MMQVETTWDTLDWAAIGSEVRRLQMRIAKAIREREHLEMLTHRNLIAGSPRQRVILERLEPCEGKLSRTVLRRA